MGGGNDASDAADAADTAEGNGSAAANGDENDAGDAGDGSDGDDADDGRERDAGEAKGQAAAEGTAGARGAEGACGIGGEGGAGRGRRAATGSGMLTVREARGLRQALAEWRRQGETIGFVPTMGALHEGHLSLLRLARERLAGTARAAEAGRSGVGRSGVGRVVVSVFVNPTQFGPGEDFDRYPRRLDSDAAMLERAGCDLLFAPDVETLYPRGHSTFVVPEGPALGLEGERRPGHFRGMATVVCTLLHLVRPDVAVFGEKDAQQLAVVRRLVTDLQMEVEILPGPTLREEDGLAMSSRNANLAADERRAATVLIRALRAAEAAIWGGERRGDEVRRVLSEVVAGEPRARLDYAEVVDAESFQPVATIAGSVVLPIAVRIGRTRLIDNLQLRVGDEAGDGDEAGAGESESESPARGETQE